MTISLAIFDLDDTLSDHHNSCVCGIRALQDAFPPLAATPLEDLVALHYQLLERYHRAILSGEETAASASPKRYREFLTAAGAAATPDVVEMATARFRAGYVAGRRAVPGAAALLQELRRRQVTVAVLTNHYSVADQQRKLSDCGLTDLIARLFVSAELGCSKPEAGVFTAVLRTFGIAARDAVMVGDSLGSDIEGALAAGLGAVWFNRRGAQAPPGCRVTVLEALEPAAGVADAILTAGAGR